MHDDELELFDSDDMDAPTKDLSSGDRSLVITSN